MAIYMRAVRTQSPLIRVKSWSNLNPGVSRHHVLLDVAGCVVEDLVRVRVTIRARARIRTRIRVRVGVGVRVRVKVRVRVRVGPL